MNVISLPQPAALSLPLETALKQRRTNRNPRADELSDEHLCALLWAAAGITSEDGRRTTPSTLDLRAVDAYVLRKDGSWRFNATNLTLEQTSDEDVRRLSTAYQFELVERAPVTIVFVADMERSKDARPQGVWVDAGTMAQSCYLAAASLGLAGCVRASFNHNTLREGMKLPERLEPIVVFTAAYPA